MHPADALIQINLGKRRFLIYVQFQAARVFAFLPGDVSARRSLRGCKSLV
jgi:hypothetical protein